MKVLGWKVAVVGLGLLSRGVELEEVLMVGEVWWVGRGYLKLWFCGVGLGVRKGLLEVSFFCDGVDVLRELLGLGVAKKFFIDIDGGVALVVFEKNVGGCGELEGCWVALPACDVKGCDAAQVCGVGVADGECG